MLLNALSLVKSFYFYMKFSRLIQITKQKKKGKKNKRLFPIHSHFRKHSPLHVTKKAGAALERTITSFIYVIFYIIILISIASPSNFILQKKIR